MKRSGGGGSLSAGGSARRRAIPVGNPECLAEGADARLGNGGRHGGRQPLLAEKDLPVPRRGRLLAGERHQRRQRGSPTTTTPGRCGGTHGPSPEGRSGDC